MAKLTTVEDAVSNFVRPGSTVYLSDGVQAVVRALLRTQRGKTLDLHVVSVRGGNELPDLIAANLVSEITVASLTHSALFAGRIAAIQMIRSADIRYNQSSLYLLSLRLMAAGMSWPFVPLGTDVEGSDVEEELGTDYLEVKIPSGTARVALPLPTDIAFVHAAAADEEGNAVLAPPYSDGVWGPRSAREGIVVTAERIVSTREIRRYSHYVKFPATSVRAVCECPFGGYPYGFDAAIPGLSVGYGPAIKAIATYREALKNLDTHRTLISSASLASSEERFISGLDSNQLEDSRRTFLQSLRQSKAIRTRKSVQPRQKLVGITVELSNLSPGQRMTLVGARRVLDSVRLRGTNVVLVGVGRPRDACAMAQSVLRAEGYDVLFVVGTGMVGLDLSSRGRPFELSSSTFLTDTVDVYGSILSGPRSRSLALLGAAQVDRRGRLNSTYIQEHDQMLAGGGGAADAATLSSEILAMVPNRAGRFVDLVDFVTSPSSRLTEVVTDFGSLRISMSTAELVLFRRFVSADDVSDAAAEMGTRSGWVPDVSEASIEPPATREEVELLRMFTLE